MSLRDRLGHEGAPDLKADARAGWLRAELMRELDFLALRELGPQQRRARLERQLASIVSRSGYLFTSAQRLSIIRQVVDEALGLGVLEPLLEDRSITEIMVNAVDEIWVERGGRLTRLEASFSSEEQLYNVIERIVTRVNRRVDEASPMVDARLPTGERVNVIIPPLALAGPTMTIRRFPRMYTMAELIEMGSLTPMAADLLRAAVLGKLNVIVSGGTGSGKTTFLNALSASIPDSERIVTIEDSAELVLQQPHAVRLEGRPANTEGAGAVSIRDLVRNSLRMRPDRIIVGEVRGGETLDMLQAMNTGHEGSLCTVHANSTLQSLSRIQTLTAMSDVKIPSASVHDQVNSAIEIIVQLARRADGSRYVHEVAALASFGQEPFDLVPLLTTTGDGGVAGPTSLDGGATGPASLPDRFRNRIAAGGFALARLADGGRPRSRRQLEPPGIRAVPQAVPEW